MYPKLLDFSKIKTYPLKDKKALISIKDVIDPNSPPPEVSQENLEKIKYCAETIKTARRNKAGVFFITGAHTIKSGGESIVSDLFIKDYFTQGLSNIASVIHSVELAYFGESSESVKENVANGTFGCWRETGELINNALNWENHMGFGERIGQLIWERNFKYRNYSLFYHCRRLGIPFSCLPSIGFDILYCNNYWNGENIGRAGGIDFKLYVSGLYEFLEGGVIISVGSSVLGPMATEKAISICNNIRIQEGKLPLTNYSIFIVDIQRNSWDWSKGEPPKDNPNYYNRIGKSYSRLGAKEVHYLEINNISFLHNLLKILNENQI